MTAHDDMADLLFRTSANHDDITDLLARVRMEQRAQFRADSIPEWEAAYDSATFTPYLIGYCNDLVSAMGAALAWFRSQVETDDRLSWEQDPQMVNAEWDQWFCLGRYDSTGTALETDIVVRHLRNGAEHFPADQRPCPGAGNPPWAVCSWTVPATDTKAAA